MGGEIGVESQEMAGSRFWFTLQLPLDESPRIVPDPGPAFPDLRVLIVGDEEVSARALAEDVASLGISQPRVVAGSAVLSEMVGASSRGEAYDIVIVNDRLRSVAPEMIVHTSRAHDQLAGAKFVLLTSPKQRRSSEDAGSAGIAAQLMRPTRLDDLQRTLLSVTTGTEVPASNGKASVEPAVSMSFDGARVLVAEDNAVNQKLVAALLQRLGCDVDLAGDGREAVELARRRQYDLVLMDCQMPNMNGYEATEAIRATSELNRSVPVVAVTAGAMTGDREKCLASGMNDYLSKPIARPKLYQALERWLPATTPVEANLEPSIDEPRTGTDG